MGSTPYSHKPSIIPRAYGTPVKTKISPHTDRRLQRWVRQMPNVMRMAVMPYERRWSDHLHVPADHEIIHVLQGQLRLESGRDQFTAGPGDTLLAKAGTPHRDVAPLGEPPVLFVCQFRWDLAPDLFRRVHNAHLLRLPAADRAELAQLFDSLRAMLHRATPAEIAARFDGIAVRTLGPAETDRPVANARLSTILLILLRHVRSSRVSNPQPPPPPRRQRPARAIIDRAQSLIATHYARPIGLRDLAAWLEMSPCHLSHLFSRETEFSFHAYLQEIRLSKAQSLLKENALPIQHVARAVGYRYPNYFARKFRQRFGYAPSACLTPTPGRSR